MGRGKADGKDELDQQPCHRRQRAGDPVGRRHHLQGASGKAEQIIASVGGNLLLESLQDSSKYDSKNKSAGFGLTLCIPPCAREVRRFR